MNPLSIDVLSMPGPSRQISNDSYNSSDNDTTVPILISTKYKIVSDDDIEFPSFNQANHLGHGTYGTVVEVFYKDLNCKAALKILAQDVTFRAVNIEAQLLHDVSHKHIILLYGVYKSQTQTGLLLELMSGGSLHQLLHKHHQVRYYADHALKWAYQCADALKYLHDRNFLHRDLKPSNMLLSDDFIHLKLCDFGTAAKLKTMMTNNCGSAAYMAPEVFKHSKYDQKCDMFSFGISLWEIITRRYPVDTEETNNYRVLWQTTMENRRPQKCKDIPKPINDLIERCWHQEPKERPDVEEVINILSILMEFFSNPYKPLIDLTTKRQAFASKLHEKPMINYSAPANLDGLARESTSSESSKIITPSAPPFGDGFENDNNKPQQHPLQPHRKAPPRPPMPNFDGHTAAAAAVAGYPTTNNNYNPNVPGHRRGRSHDFGAQQNYDPGYVSSQSTINLLPTPPPYAPSSSSSPGTSYSPCRTNMLPPQYPQQQQQQQQPIIGFNASPSPTSLIPNVPIYPTQPHLAAPTQPIGWRRQSEPPVAGDYGVPNLGNGYNNDSSSSGCNNSSSGTDAVSRAKKKGCRSHGLKKFLRDLAKP